MASEMESSDEECEKPQPALSRAASLAQLGSMIGHNFREAALEVESTPGFVWPVFVISTIAGSSAGPITKLMQGASPLAVGGWRYQVSALVLLPPFIWEWCRLSKAERQMLPRPQTVFLLFVSTLGLAGSFTAFVWSLDRTSLPHSLFLSAMSPLFVAVYTVLSGRSIAAGEVAGVFLCLLGAIMLAAGTGIEDDSEATFIGDLVAFLSSAGVATYLTSARKLRGSGMPLFMYQFVCSLAVVFMLGGLSALADEFQLSEGLESRPFAWIKKDYVIPIILLGTIPGILGQLGFTIVVKYASALLMPTGLSLTPIVGSAIGWALRESSVPGLWSCLGGGVALLGTLCVTFARSQQNNANKILDESKRAQSDDEYQQPADPGPDEEYGQESLKKALLRPRPSDLISTTDAS